MAKKNNTPAKPKLPPEEALFQALSLCRKAGALTMGFDAVEDACVKSKAWLVMVASDASAKTVQRLNYSVGDLVDVITMPLTQDKLADISRKPVAVYAVTDRNLAKPVSYTHLGACPLQRGARRKHDRGDPDPAHYHGGGHHGQDRRAGQDRQDQGDQRHAR